LIDALATPTLPPSAPELTATVAQLPGGERPLVRACLDFTLPLILTGQPAISVPGGFAEGIPLGLQLVGRPVSESTLLRIAHHYQRETKWHQQHCPAAKILPG